MAMLTKSIVCYRAKTEHVLRIELFAVDAPQTKIVVSYILKTFIYRGENLENTIIFRTMQSLQKLSIR
jgi:hypothetical protein